MNVTQPTLEVHPREELSLRGRLSLLALGESYCMAVRLKAGEATSEVVDAAAQRLHNTARPAISRAKRSTGFDYQTAVGNWITSHGKDPVVCFLITRTK